MRVVLVGCGSISALWLGAVREISSLELVGLVDVVEANAEKRAEEFGFDVPTGDDLSKMLRDVQPDTVFDCTVPTAHYEVTLKALQHGCHVFGEKPMADTLAQAREMMQASQNAGKTYAVMQNRRFDPNIRTLKKFLDTGVIGEVTTINSDFYIGAHFGGFRDEMRHVLIKDMAIHTFDAARFLSSKDARAVYCHEWNPAGSWYAHGASAMAIFELEDDVVFNYRGSWSGEGIHTTWEAAWHVIGTKGSLTWDGAEGLVCKVVAGTDGLIREQREVEGPELRSGAMPDWHKNAIQAFVEAVEAGREPETVCTDNIKSLSMVYGAVESAETKRRIEMETL